MRLQSAIFDMDGLLFDTERLYQESWAALAETFGLTHNPAFPPAVAGTGGTGFRLHFLNFRNNTPKVLLFGCRPRISPFTHRRRRGNRVNNADFIHAVGNGSRGFVTVHHFHFNI